MTSVDERRRFTRVRFDTAATLSQGNTVFHTHVLDISLNGVLLETPAQYNLRADKSAHICIFLSETVEIHMTVDLVHSTETFLGFHCSSIDMESISHLRRLIELNIEDPSAHDRVLDELVMPH